MRKFILVAAMVLASASAQAGASRGLALASGDEPVATEQPKACRSTPKTTEAPKFVERPALDTAKISQGSAQGRPGQTRREKRADRSRRHGGWTSARIVYKLHRYGIYW